MALHSYTTDVRYVIMGGWKPALPTNALNVGGREKEEKMK
jgi:hypothetical protein